MYLFIPHLISECTVKVDEKETVKANRARNKASAYPANLHPC